MRVIALVPARGGSKGVPGKNLVEVGGLTLVERAVKSAGLAASVDATVVSSDDEMVLEVAERCGATPLRRDDQLALDETPSLEVVRDFVEGSLARSADALVLLQPTSPFRSPDDIDACAAHLESGRSAATICLNEHPVEWLFAVGVDGRLSPHTTASPDRRQDAQVLYRLAGSVYATSFGRIRSGAALVDKDTIGVEVPRHRALDIDDQLDIEIAQALANSPYDPLRHAAEHP